MAHQQLNDRADLVHDCHTACTQAYNKFEQSEKSLGSQMHDDRQAWTDAARLGLEMQLQFMQQARESSIQLPERARVAIDLKFDVPPFTLAGLESSVNKARTHLKNAKPVVQRSIDSFIVKPSSAASSTPFKTQPGGSTDRPSSSSHVAPRPLASLEPNRRVTRSSAAQLREAPPAVDATASFRVTRSSVANVSSLTPVVSAPDTRTTRSISAKLQVAFPSPGTTPKKIVPKKRRTPVSDNAAKSLKQGARPCDDSDYFDDSDDENNDLLQTTKTKADDKQGKVDDASSSEKPIVAVDIGEEDQVTLDRSDAFTDEDGLIHVGPQPVKVHSPAVKSAPEVEARGAFEKIMRYNVRNTEPPLLGKDPVTLRGIEDRLREQFTESLVTSSNGMIRRYCDYTGMELCWSGGPLAFSLEALYHYVGYNGHLAYHSPPNVGLVARILNLSKGRASPLMLPLVSAWFKILKEPNLGVQRSQAVWIMNAAGNMGTLESAIDCRRSRTARFVEWSVLSAESQRSILGALRTGEKTQFVTDTLDGALSDIPLRGRLLGQPGLDVTATLATSKKINKNMETWNDIYLTLVDIAKRYGLSPLEFETYCTIPRPEGIGRVFFPYHILSRPQAVSIGWDWHLLSSMAKSTLRVMRNHCNKHAQAAGHGEPEVNDIKYIYWLGHHLCESIRIVKIQRP
ncbi:hypothetical protein ACHAPI_011467 [Fusarium lateritium]